MKPVYQDRFGYGEGNCVWACIASIFEIPLESLHGERAGPCDADLTKWTDRAMPHLEYRYEDCAYDYELVPGPSTEKHPHPERWTYKVPATFKPPPVQFWGATVWSPKLKHPIDSPWYGMPGLHMVVMEGDKMIHDPNPNYTHDELYSPVVAKSWWTAR